MAARFAISDDDGAVIAAPARHVHIVDDCGDAERSTALLLQANAFTIDQWASGAAFLKDVADARPGCVLLDTGRSGRDGLAVLEDMTRGGWPMPVVTLTGRGDVVAAITAMKAGATDVVEKPVRKAALLRAIEDALAKMAGEQQRAGTTAAARMRLSALTAREHDVLRGLVDGLSNKGIAQAIGISPRTVEIHRANVLRKLDVTSLSQAVRVALTADIFEMPA